MAAALAGGKMAQAQAQLINAPRVDFGTDPERYAKLALQARYERYVTTALDRMASTKKKVDELQKRVETRFGRIEKPMSKAQFAVSRMRLREAMSALRHELRAMQAHHALFTVNTKRLADKKNQAEWKKHRSAHEAAKKALREAWTAEGHKIKDAAPKALTREQKKRADATKHRRNATKGQMAALGRKAEQGIKDLDEMAKKVTELNKLNAQPKKKASAAKKPQKKAKASAAKKPQKKRVTGKKRSRAQSAEVTDGVVSGLLPGDKPAAKRKPTSKAGARRNPRRNARGD